MIWSIISEILINILIDLLVGVFVKLAMAAFSAISNTLLMQICSSQLDLAY